MLHPYGIYGNEKAIDLLPILRRYATCQVVSQWIRPYLTQTSANAARHVILVAMRHRAKGNAVRHVTTNHRVGNIL